MKLRFIVVGRDRQDLLCQAAADYVARICHYYPAEVVEIKEESAKSATPGQRLRAAERERIEKALGPGDYVVALDERGRELPSTEVAKKLDRWALDGRARVCFLIGGSTGLDRDLVARAHETWSLSKMTLPHRLARAVLTEQIYRGCTILRGEPYHK